VTTSNRAFAALLLCSGLRAQTPAIPALLDELATASRILARQGIVDAYGHVTVRSPANPSHFFMSRNLPPALATAADMVEYDLDSQPVSPNAPPGFTERYIHGEIYRARPEVMAVVHFHAPDVIPFGVTAVPLRPIFHMAGFLGGGVPIFEIRETGIATDMLIRNRQLGAALARTLGNKPAALMRGHGAVVVAGAPASSSANAISGAVPNPLHVAVGEAYYMTVNARLQAQAIQLGGSKVVYLSDDEARMAGAQDGFERAWTLWKSEVAH
jgi:HCOMODA/2-hydroxy-3-carboxy-muconic semialdehyde decarboxylase